MDKLKAQVEALYERNYSYVDLLGYDSAKVALLYLKENLIDKRATAPMTREYLIHGLSMMWLLIELQLPVSKEDLDLMLSASGLHILTELNDSFDLTILEDVEGLNKNAIPFICNITKADQYYEMIVQDRLLLIVKMVERSNVIEHLCDMSTDEAKMFMIEAKRYLFSLCLEGKERYPEFDAALTGILEKMRGLIQVMDILFKKYDAEEDALYEEILNLKEENARIRFAMRNRYNIIYERENNK